MNLINQQRSARWVSAFGIILEVDRKRPLPADRTGRRKAAASNAKVEKNRD